MATAARAGLKVRIDTVDRVARASKVRGCAVLPIFAVVHFALHCQWQNEQHCMVSCTSDVTTGIMAPHKCGSVLAAAADVPAGGLQQCCSCRPNEGAHHVSQLRVVEPIVHLSENMSRTL